MLREENGVLVDLFGFQGFRVQGTAEERLVKKDFTLPASTNLTIESNLKKQKNGLTLYTRGELSQFPAGLMPCEVDPRLVEMFVYVPQDLLFSLTLPVAGDLYSAWNWTGKPAYGAPFDSFIFQGYVNGPSGYLGLHFVKSETGSELEGDEFENESLLPPTKFLSELKIQTIRQVVPYGTAADDDADVLKSKVTPIDGVRSLRDSRIILPFTGEILYSWELDEETGKGYEVAEQLVSPGTVGSTEVAADGTFSKVTPVNTKWSIKTTSKTTTLDSTPTTYTKTERSPVYWPAVLLSHKFQMVIDASTLAYWHKKLFYSLKAAYTGDVQVTYSEWWQKSEPSPITAIEMIPTSIHIPREWSENISIPECLHPLFEVTEGIVGGPFPYTGDGSLVGIQTARYYVPATNVVDWPDEVVKLDIDRYMGGFKCVKRVVQKPQVTVEGVDVQALAYEGGIYYQHNYDPDGAG